MRPGELVDRSFRNDFRTPLAFDPPRRDTSGLRPAAYGRKEVRPVNESADKSGGLVTRFVSIGKRLRRLRGLQDGWYPLNLALRRESDKFVS